MTDLKKEKLKDLLKTLVNLEIFSYGFLLGYLAGVF